MWSRHRFSSAKSVKARPLAAVHARCRAATRGNRCRGRGGAQIRCGRSLRPRVLYRRRLQRSRRSISGQYGARRRIMSTTAERGRPRPGETRGLLVFTSVVDHAMAARPQAMRAPPLVVGWVVSGSIQSHPGYRRCSESMQPVRALWKQGGEASAPARPGLGVL